MELSTLDILRQRWTVTRWLLVHTRREPVYSTPEWHAWDAEKRNAEHVLSTIEARLNG